MANNENAYTKYAKYSYEDILSVRDELTPAILPSWAEYVKALHTAEDAREKLEHLRANPVYVDEATDVGMMRGLSSRYVKALMFAMRELNFRVVDANYVLAKFVLGMDIHKSQIIDQYDKDTGIVKYIWFDPAMLEVNKA